MLLDIGRGALGLPAPSKALVVLMASPALVLAVLHLARKLTHRRPAPAPQTGHRQALKMAADPVSSLFPNRPIRPLPKRRLRERLSPEVADSIQYPPLPQSVAPLFPYPYHLRQDSADPSPAPAGDGGSHPERPQSQPQPQGNNSGSGHEESNASPKQGGVNRLNGHQTSLVTRPKPDNGRYSDSLPLLSAASSADGYDPFENTNNKKRKIPTASDSAPSSNHTGSDSAGGTSSVPAAAQSTEGQGEASGPTSTSYYGSGSLTSGTHNVPGPGRGRYGRPRSSKNVLRPLFDSTNSWAGRTGKPRSGQWTAGSGESAGPILSNLGLGEPPVAGHYRLILLALMAPHPHPRLPTILVGDGVC